MIRPTLSRVVFTFIVVALAVAGCRSGGRGASPTPPGSVPASSASSASTSEGDAAVAAYRGMWTAFVEAAKTADPDAPALRQYASDDALKLIVNSLVDDQAKGKVVKGPLVTNPKVTGLQPPDQPTEATVDDCVDSTNWLEYKKSGELWDNLPGGRHHTTATVKSTGGMWKVSSFKLEKAGTC